MAETLRELVVALSLDSSNFSRNMRSINQQIKEATQGFLHKFSSSVCTGFSQNDLPPAGFFHQLQVQPQPPGMPAASKHCRVYPAFPH